MNIILQGRKARIVSIDYLGEPVSGKIYYSYFVYIEFIKQEGIFTSLRIPLCKLPNSPVDFVFELENEGDLILRKKIGMERKQQLINTLQKELDKLVKNINQYQGGK